MRLFRLKDFQITAFRRTDMKKIYETIMTASGSNSRAFPGIRRRLVICSVFFLVILFAGTQHANAAKLGMSHTAYGVWDNSGDGDVQTYPFLRGSPSGADWAAVHPGRSNYNWSVIDDAINSAYSKLSLIHI